MTKRLSICEKANIFEKLGEPGATLCSVAKSFGVSRKTVQNVIANKELLEERMKMRTSLKRCHLRIDEKFGEINEATFQWFIRMRETRGEVPLSESVICEKNHGYC